MNRILESIDYKNIFKYFEEISNIPRGSGYNQKISDYLVDFAKSHNFKYVRDDSLNVIIYKDATKGYEDMDTLILQSHMDMVCEKDEDIEHDFENEGLELIVEDGFVRANKTTLGADDGIGIAYSLAFLDSDKYQHPKIKAVITVDEEIGMLGADKLKAEYLDGGFVLNLDQEEEGIMLSSCAGGVGVDGEIPLEIEKKEGLLIEFFISNLRGGHSGAEIHNHRMNGDIIFARVMKEICKKLDVRFKYISGGMKDNVIPNEVVAHILVEKKDVKDFYNNLLEIYNILKKEYFAYEKNMTFSLCMNTTSKNRVSIEDLDYFNKVFDSDLCEQNVECTTRNSTKVVYDFLLAIPNGVQKMSASIDGLVESSLNIGMFLLDNGKVMTKHLIRSSVNTYKSYLCDRLEIIYNLFDGKMVTDSGYLAWEYKEDSKLRPLSKKVYKDLFKKELKVEALHAGLECGVLSSKNENLDIVAFGPEIKDIHTTREKLDIESAKRMFDFMVNIIKEMKNI